MREVGELTPLTEDQEALVEAWLQEDEGCSPEVAPGAPGTEEDEDDDSTEAYPQQRGRKKQTKASLRCKEGRNAEEGTGRPRKGRGAYHAAPKLGLEEQLASLGLDGDDSDGPPSPPVRGGRRKKK